MLPSINLTTATPAVMATNTIAKPTDKAEVYLKESINTNKIKAQKSIKISHYFLAS